MAAPQSSDFRLAFCIFFRWILVPGFHWPAQFDGERLTMTIPGLPSGYANPAFGNAIFPYSRADPVLEPATAATLKLLQVVMLASGIGREAIGRFSGLLHIF